MDVLIIFIQMEGFILLHRKLTAWEWYKHDHMARLFIHLLLTANHKEATWQGTLVKRGQLITGIHQLSFHTGISQQSLRTCLKRLERGNEISVKSTNKFSLITIVKYEDYQTTNKPANKQLTNKQQTTNKQLTTNNNVNNDNNVKNEKESSSKEPLQQNDFNLKENLPIPITIEMVRDYFKENKYLESEADKFFLHYSAAGWKTSGGAPITNWKQLAVSKWFKEDAKEKKPKIYY